MESLQQDTAGHIHLEDTITDGAFTLRLTLDWPVKTASQRDVLRQTYEEMLKKAQAVFPQTGSGKASS